MLLPSRRAALAAVAGMSLALAGLAPSAACARQEIPSTPPMLGPVSRPTIGGSNGQSNGQNGATTQVDPAIAQQQRQLQVFGPILLNPSDDIDSATRKNAASEILDMRIPEAQDVLRQALQSRRPPIALAAIAALQSQANPPVSMLAASVAALEAAPPETVQALASVLARYGEAAVAPVSELALRSNTTARQNAVIALGSFRTREAAAALMRVIDNAPTGPNPLLDPGGMEVLRTALASLERMTGLPYGQDLAAWRTWWTQAAGDSNEQWYRLISESLATRAAELQQRLHDQQIANSNTSKELFDTYRDLYPALPIDEQLRRLPRLLRDKLAPVRLFGLSRVAVLTRDSVRMTPEVIELVRQTLGDVSPEIRIAAADLLEELNDERAAEAVAARLAIENDAQVIASLLRVLSHSPTSAAMDPAIRLLGEDAVADAAADALWEMLQYAVATPENQARVRDAARLAAQRRTSASTLRLAALAGDERDVVDLTALLDGDDRTQRAAVAEGFWKRGLRQPLIDRADDDAVYPFAIRALADGPADLANFNLLVGLRPGESNKRLWNEMVVRLASRLQPAELPAADDSLRNVAYADASLRRDVLIAGAALPRDTLPASERLHIIERLAPVLIDLGDATRAWELLESLNGAVATSPSLRIVQFQAAALTGHFDRAAALQNDPGTWVSLLGREAQRAQNLPACTRLYDEINRRFADALNPEEQQRLGEIKATLNGGDQRG